MGNVKSIEYGILVKGADNSFFDLLDGQEVPVKVAGLEEDEELYIQTSPHEIDYVFISFGNMDDDRLEEVPEKPPEFNEIVAWLKSKDPKVEPKWGIIWTER